MEQVNSPWGLLPKGWRLSTIDEEKERLTDYVANGSFASLASNVHYKDTEDYAVLIRLVDFNNDFRGPFVYIDEHAYNFLSKSSLSGGEIIISNVGANVGTVFKCPNLPYKMSLAPNAITIKLKGDNDFYYYWFKSKIGQANIQALVTGSAQPKFNKTNFRSMYIPVPPLKDQRRIASILSSLDRKIELNNKINADLEEMAQAIFKNWLSECTDEVTIGELSLNVTNYEKTNAEKVVLINSSDVTEGYFDHHNYSPNKNLKGHFKKRFQKGDILYSQVRPRNRHWAYCNFEANDYLASTQLMVIRNNPSLITSILLYQYIISDNVWKEFTLKTETRSGTFPQGNYEDLSQIRVPYNSDVEGISNQLDTLYAKMFMLEKENSRLSLLRDTLLPRLMSGELEVPE